MCYNNPSQFFSTTTFAKESKVHDTNSTPCIEECPNEYTLRDFVNSMKKITSAIFISAVVVVVGFVMMAAVLQVSRKGGVLAILAVPAVAGILITIYISLKLIKDALNKSLKMS